MGTETLDNFNLTIVRHCFIHYLGSGLRSRIPEYILKGDRIWVELQMLPVP